MRTPFLLLGLLLGLPSCFAREAELPRGALLFNAADATKNANTFVWDFNAERWGMYDVRVAYTSSKATSATVTLGEEKFGDRLPAGENHIAKLGRHYLAGQGKQALELFTNAKVDYLLLVPAPEGGNINQSDEGNIELPAKNALTHSVKMRYEPTSAKNCLGFWVHAEDWAEWRFRVVNGGRFEVEVTQGCGKGNGGSDVAVHVGTQRLNFIVEDTGGWQNWKPRIIGTVDLETGPATLLIKPKNKQKKAVMDIRTIRLIKSK